MVKMPLRWRHSQESFSLLKAEQAIVGYPYELTTTIKFDLGTFPSLNLGGICGWRETAVFLLLNHDS